MTPSYSPALTLAPTLHLLTMITLFPSHTPTVRYRPGRIPKYAQRNQEVDLAQMTPKQAKTEAQRVLTAGLSPQTLRLLDLLATGGVFSAARLGLADRTLGIAVPGAATVTTSVTAD